MRALLFNSVASLEDILNDSLCVVDLPILLRYVENKLFFFSEGFHREMRFLKHILHK